MLKVDGFGCLMDHLGSIWGALGMPTIFSVLQDINDTEKDMLVQCKTHLPLTKFYIFFILPFFFEREILGFHLYFIYLSYIVFESQQDFRISMISFQTEI